MNDVVCLLICGFEDISKSGEVKDWECTVQGELEWWAPAPEIYGYERLEGSASCTNALKGGDRIHNPNHTALHTRSRPLPSGQAPINYLFTVISDQPTPVRNGARRLEPSQIAVLMHVP